MPQVAIIVSEPGPINACSVSGRICSWRVRRHVGPRRVWILSGGSGSLLGGTSAVSSCVDKLDDSDSSLKWSWSPSRCLSSSKRWWLLTLSRAKFHWRADGCKVLVGRVTLERERHSDKWIGACDPPRRERLQHELSAPVDRSVKSDGAVDRTLLKTALVIFAASMRAPK
ncbi:unnamed protein product [Phytophthora lilii]|uniref:Unnamed protein product n=1 Tax=Phytophthora lilii TaxID=2077276 RepID=A0A9W6U1S4_9STRA|nr:unnamed protein product [Phytophthora lilii]